MKKRVEKKVKECKHYFELDGGQCIKCGKTVADLLLEEPEDKIYDCINYYKHAQCEYSINNGSCPENCTHYYKY